MTMMNLHYRYFSGKVTPMEIINKYSSRGFGIFLNKKKLKNYLNIRVIMNFGEIFMILIKSKVLTEI